MLDYWKFGKVLSLVSYKEVLQAVNDLVLAAKTSSLSSRSWLIQGFSKDDVCLVR